MTGRERLIAVMNREPTDRLSWTILVDDCTLTGLPERLGVRSGTAFARHLGCDILQLEGWGTPYGFASPTLEWGGGVVESQHVEGGDLIRELRGPEGLLTSICRRGHPAKYLVQDRADLHAYIAFWEAARFTARDDLQAFAEVDGLIGSDGLAIRFWGPSTVPKLLEFDIGIAQFYYLLRDHTGDMERLISIMHEREIEAFGILAQGPCDVITLVENTCTAYISPEVYQRYNGPHVRDFVEITHAQKKTALIHMCGHIKGLLDLIKATDLDGVHALTPPPTGDTPWEVALDVLGDDTVIVGLLDPSVFVMGPVDAIPTALEQLYTPRVRAAPCVLCLAADGIAVPIERFEVVARWMSEQSGPDAI